MHFSIKRISILSFVLLAVTFLYSSNGNRLVSVTDEVEEAALYDRKEYHDLNTDGHDFTYDANGNMTTDKDRDITSVKYNMLNLPDEILFSPHGDEISNMYLADGRRVFTTATTRTPVVSPSLGLDAPIPRANAAPRRDTIWMESSESTFYLGNLVCTQDNSLPPAFRKIAYKLLTPEGYVDEDGNYYYYRRDHLGNVREVWKATDSIALTVQRTRYYPSGLPWEYQAGDSASLQPYKYGSKEFVETHGLDMYDSHARWYYATIMRPTTMDPLAEKYYNVSPYVWCGNNPVRNIDTDGREIKYYIYQDDAWEEVSFSELDSNIQKAIEMFAQTDEGYDFFASFANKGDKIGSVEFDQAGVFSKHNYNLFQISGSNILGGALMRHASKDKLNFDVQINKDRDVTSGQTIEDYVTTLAHENFIHLGRYIEEAIKLHEQGRFDDLRMLRTNVFNNAENDHRGYMRKDETYLKMYKLIRQLPNPQNANTAINRHNQRYK